MDFILQEKEISEQDKDRPADTSGETYTSNTTTINQTAATPSNNE